jgi:deoxyribodipyrimidine photo-lyase
MAQPVIMWFRQDLRLADNAALRAASAAGPVLPLFILDDETPGAWRWGGASRWWLHRSLESLRKTVPVVLKRGKADDVIAEMLRSTNASGVCFTRDYAPWSNALERRVQGACKRAGAACHRYGGFLLHEPESIRTGSGEPYKVYTPFSRACFAAGAPKPPRGQAKFEWWTAQAGDTLDDWKLLPTRPNWAMGFEKAWTPGEPGARRRLEDFLRAGLERYADERDRADRASVSRLSPHLHWGEISPAQCWAAVRAAMAGANGKLDRTGEKFLKELLWREFSYHLLHHWPDLPHKPFRPEFAEFPWARNDTNLNAWRKGLTGYPIVDAGMRELWATGIMHNRVRMIAASFLIKDLLIPWQTGARWFWDTLVDADIGNNSASWQWVAGCGADAAPYFRIFNPVLQGEKFDPDGAYVRRWVPELARLPKELIHRPWDASPLERQGYPAPIVDHGKARDRALAAFRHIKGGMSE